MQLETVAVLGGICAVSAAVLVDIGVTLHVRIKHGLIDASIVALVTLEGFGSKVVSQMVLKMMLVFCYKWTFWALQDLVFLDVGF